MNLAALPKSWACVVAFTAVAVLSAEGLAQEVVPGGEAPETPLPLSAPEPPAYDALVAEFENLHRAPLADALALLDRMRALDANRPESYWMRVRALWVHGEAQDPNNKAARLKAYEEGIRVAAECVARFPRTPECYFWQAASLARRATAMGVVRAFFAGAFKPAAVEAMLLKTVALKPTYQNPARTTNTLADAHTALANFYRQAPRGFLARMLLGTEGDKAKSLAHMRKAVKILPQSLRIQKELAVSMLCYGQSEDDRGVIEAGKRVLLKLTEANPRDRLETIDREHAKWLLREPEIACKYNRDGVQDVEGDVAKREAAGGKIGPVEGGKEISP